MNQAALTAFPAAPSGTVPALPADVLHGLVLRPPVASWDGQRYQGSQLAHARLDEAKAMAGVVAVVQRTHFVGAVAVASVYARQAVASLEPVWLASEPDLVHRQALPSQPSNDPSYIWRMPREQAPDGAQVTVWCLDGHTSVWIPSCAPDVQCMLQRELAELLQLPMAALRLTHWAGGLSEAEQALLHPLDLIDTAADAALLSQAVGRPVSVSLQAGAASGEPIRELVLSVPAVQKSAHALQLKADEACAVRAATLISEIPWAVRPSLARLLSQPGLARAIAHATVCDAGTVQACKNAGGLQHAGVDDLNAAQVFAQESLWHEQALAQGQEPLDWRLRHLPQGRVRDLAQQVADQAQWSAADQARGQQAGDSRLLGRGFAMAQLQAVDAGGKSNLVWSAWVAEVAVHPQTGEIEVTRVVAGHDSQSLHAAQGATVRPEIVQQDPQLLANARQLLGAPAMFDNWTSPSFSNAASGSLARRDGQASLADSMQQDGALIRQGSLNLDGVVTLPAAAAIANAIHHATGVRMREVPFNPEKLRLALTGSNDVHRSRGLLSRSWSWLAAGAAGAAGLAAMAWPLKPDLPLTAGPDVSLYSPQAIERGRLVAAAGDCVVCHTVPGGVTNAGGFGLETPFGIIYSTNITPDNETGIGRWSYTAFERAMRQGIHQDGRQLYPAFPYTAFAKLSDGDLQALYGYLMSQPAVKSKTPETQLAFPYNLRPAMAGWNLLFHNATPFKPDLTKNAEWNRGAYLVQGAGHCAACHSPRNALGAEKTGIHYLGGGEAEGWSAPALDQLATGKLPWSSDELYQYLRTGYSARHGVAAGPMAPVIHGLAELPESDVHSMVTYLMALQRQEKVTVSQTVASETIPEALVAASVLPTVSKATAEPVFDRHVNGERIYQNACAVCHEAGSGPTLFGVKPLLGLNTNLHAASPDNLIQVVLNGIQTPANDALGYMPGFKDSLDDRQIADLLGYLRERFAPKEESWPNDTTKINRLRMQSHAHQN